MTPFVCFSLPRSRSTWLSVFLSRPGRLVGHDIGVTCASPAEFSMHLQHDLIGTCETGAAFAWRLIKRIVPDVRFVVVKRDPAEVQRSLARFGLADPDLEQRAELLDEISAQHGTLTVSFESLTRQASCAELYEHCLHAQMDPHWWAALDPINIQVDMARQLERLHVNRFQIESLKAEVGRQMAHV